MKSALVRLTTACSIPLLALAPHTATATIPEIAIDHVVVAVHELDAATVDLEGLGFTIKDGRPHPDGIRNRHVKLHDLESIEILSVVEPATGIGATYREFLADGEGGAYLAFRARPEAVEAAARALGVSTRRIEAGGFTYVVFPDPGWEAVFAMASYARVDDPDSLRTHACGATRIAEVSVEAPPELGRLLEAFGAEPLPTGPENGDDRRYALGSRTVRILPVPDPGARPRVRDVVLVADGAPPWTTVEFHGIRITARDGTRSGR